MQKEAVEMSKKEIPEERNLSDEDSEEDVQFEESWEEWCLRHGSFEHVEPREHLTPLKEPPRMFVIIVCWLGIALRAIETALDRCRMKIRENLRHNL